MAGLLFFTFVIPVATHQHKAPVLPVMTTTNIHTTIAIAKTTATIPATAIFKLKAVHRFTEAVGRLYFLLISFK